MLAPPRLASGDFADDADPVLRWRLPSALEPLKGADGVPQVMLALGPDGGVLQLRLGVVWALDGDPARRPAPIESARCRLCLAGPSPEAGAWRPAIGGNDTTLTRALSLGPVEAAIARRLLSNGDSGAAAAEAVLLEFECLVAGRTRALPWLVRVPSAPLRERLAAALGDVPATRQTIEAAFLSLDPGLFEWLPQAVDALPPPRDEALTALAAQAVGLLFVPTGDTAPGAETSFSLAPAGAASVAFDLRVPRAIRLTHRLRWSMSDFLAGVADRARHLVSLSAPAPFEAATLTLANDLPLAAQGLQQLDVEVRSGGPSGLLAHRFGLGEPSVARLPYVRAGADAGPLQWRVRYTVASGAAPVVGQTDFVAVPGTLVALDAQSVGLRVLRFGGAGELFSHLQAIEIPLGSRTLRLTGPEPTNWAVGRTPPASVTPVAVLASGERRPLEAAPLGADGLWLDGSAIGLGESAELRIEAPPDLAARAAYLAVQVEGQAWRTLDAGAAIRLRVRRTSRLQAPTLRYRTRHVPRGADGATRPIAESDWRAASGEALVASF